MFTVIERARPGHHLVPDVDRNPIPLGARHADPRDALYVPDGYVLALAKVTKASGHRKVGDAAIIVVREE